MAERGTHREPGSGKIPLAVQEPAAFRWIIEQFPDGIAIHQAGRLVFVNDALATLLGYASGAELLGRDWRDFMPERQQREAAGNVMQALEREPYRRFDPVQRELIAADGALVPVELVAIGMRLDGPPALLVVVHDMRERRRLETQLREADRMAAVGTLAAGVAHEVNNPLAYIIGNLSFAREQIARLNSRSVERVVPELAEAIEEAHVGVQRVRQVVSDLKTFTRDHEQRERIDLAPVVESTIKVALPEIRHRARLLRSLEPTPQVMGNETRLAQVLLNLLVNAAQAFEDEGHPDNVISVELRSERDGALLRVEDNGPGIPPQLLERVVEPFFTTKPVGVGTGLGLSVCKNIVEGLGGELTIESEIAIGTRVSVWLPAAGARDKGRSSSRTSSVGLRPPRRCRVLVIDDDLLVLKATARSLRAHDVTTANSGQAALDLLEQDPGFHVILCDLMMPEITGMDVYERLAERQPELAERIVFLSGGAVTERARSFLERVDNPRYEKPLLPKQFSRILIDALAARPGPPGSDPPD